MYFQISMENITTLLLYLRIQARYLSSGKIETIEHLENAYFIFQSIGNFTMEESGMLLKA